MEAKIRVTPHTFDQSTYSAVEETDLGDGDTTICHIVRVHNNGKQDFYNCTCNSLMSYVSDFGPIERRYVPCKHIAAVEAERKSKQPT